VNPHYLCAELGRALGEDDILVNEAIRNAGVVFNQIVRTRPGTSLGFSGGGLGCSAGLALGAKLAAPQRTVVCAVGDGAYMFGNPTPAHYVSEAMRLPVLWVVFNNARWAAVHRATLSMYPKGSAAKMSEPFFTTLEPSPRFEKIVEASGGVGTRVEDPAELMPALERAMRVVREEKRQALVNVRLQASYVKTS